MEPFLPAPTLVVVGWLKSVHAPIGLDIGARSPGEIALAVAAELLAVNSGGTGQPLSRLGRSGRRRPVLHTVDLLDDPALINGAVCGGKMEVWIEPIHQ